MIEFSSHLKNFLWKKEFKAGIKPTPLKTIKR